MNSASRGTRRDRRRPGGPLRRAFVALLVAGVAVACGPAEGGGPAVSAPPTLSSSAPTTEAPSPTPSLTPSPSASPTTSATPTTAPKPTPTPPSGSDYKAPGSDPAPTRAATKPAPRPTTEAPAEPAKADCEIVSNAGNCYNAGQYCRNADVGRSTHAGNGRMIHCRQDGSKARWGY
ncbi:hypothetical protein OOK31_16550 [Streptomyces sp. NBC_00249]|uniref:hypothetical protein n=1 Tax=Streptomyces sp. NBC_00249 TaxID=2975690 RepID=UPI0022502251|nr:hypothetical protein [Streptomyces sp. NBC_00249]MCX5195495.1 hypothetical protein [Streptomyces sp. NBC_00249]